MSEKVEEVGGEGTRFIKFDPHLPEIRRPLRKLIAKSSFDVQEFLTNAELALKDVAADKKLEAPDPDFLFALSLLVDLKVNIQTRFAFRLPAAPDSLTVLGHGNAERLLGKGDFYMQLNGGLDVRLQSYFVP